MRFMVPDQRQLVLDIFQVTTSAALHLENSLFGPRGVYRRNKGFATQKCSVKNYVKLPDKDCPQKGKVGDDVVVCVLGKFRDSGLKIADVSSAHKHSMTCLRVRHSCKRVVATLLHVVASIRGVQSRALFLEVCCSTSRKFRKTSSMLNAR
ncbi:hypothetical protein [Polaromonas sp. YR568]|uniref:hypothetical protein n=1 Tax=Polaromonas sp. YR568 TaxID=1855301 RepID=UPI00398C1EC7